MSSTAAVLAAAVTILVAVSFQTSLALSFCDMNEDGLLACKPSVTKPNPVPPTPECCQALEGADLKCLCSYKNSMVLPSLGIDPDLAFALPSQCDITLPTDC